MFRKLLFGFVALAGMLCLESPAEAARWGYYRSGWPYYGSRYYGSSYYPYYGYTSGYRTSYPYYGSGYYSTPYYYTGYPYYSYYPSYNYGYTNTWPSFGLFY